MSSRHILIVRKGSVETSSQVVPLFVDGVPTALDNTSRIEPVNSFATNETVHHYVSAEPSACTRACESAWTAFAGTPLDPGRSGWKRASTTTRRDLLLRVADLFDARREDLVRAQMRETSCADPWARMNVAMSVGYLREIAACVSSLHGSIPPMDKPDTLGLVFLEPVGPVLVIPPWNAALVLSTRALASAIGAGCTVVLKASELCPFTHSLMVQIFHDAGAPAGVLNSLQCRREDAAEVTETLIASPRIRKVEFIGSAAVGRMIGSTCAKHLKPILMELGGKCPAIVLEDANLQQAAVLCAKGATLHHGQICFSTERIIVHEAAWPAFRPLLIKAFEGEPASQPVHAGIAAKATSLLEQAASTPGVEFLVGSPTASNRPALLLVPAHTSPDALAIVDDESFAPCACVYVVADDAAAVALANASAYGLNATVHTRDMQRGVRLGRELEYGQVHVNSISVFTAATGPQGGVKGSGWGRQNAGFGLREFVVERFVSFHGSG